MSITKKIGRSINLIISISLLTFAIILSFLMYKLISMIAISPEIILSLAIIIASLLLIFLRPKYFVYIALLLWPLRGLINPDTRFATGSLLSFDLNGLINILIIFLGIIYLLINYKNPFSGSIAATYIIFLAFCILSLIYSEYLYGGIRFFTRITSPFMFYLITLNEVKREEDTSNLVKCILFSAVFPLAVGIYQLISGQGNTDTEGLARIYGTFEHPNAYSFFLVFIFCISYTVLLTNKSKWKIYILFLLNAVIAALIIQTYCRISWIAFLAVFFLISYRYRKKKTIIISLSLTILVYAFFSSSILERLVSATKIFGIDRFIESLKYNGDKSLLIENSLFETGNSLGWRLNAWVYLLRKMTGHLVIGHGLGTVFSAMHDLYETYIHPHNAYIGILYDTGIVGLLLFIIFVIVLFRKAVYLMRNIKKEDSRYNNVSIFLTCLMSFIIISTSDNIFENPSVSIYFWVFFAIGSSIYQSFNKNKNAS